MTCAGCASFRLPTAKVEIPSDCERILVRVPAPVIKAGDDMRTVVVRHRVALGKANNEIDNGRGCIADVRQRYGSAK